MDIVNRAKNICLTPNTEWPVIAAEPTPPATLITEYVVPLAAIGAVAGFIGGSIVGTGLGMFGVDQRQRDERPAILGPAGQRREFIEADVGGADLRDRPAGASRGADSERLATDVARPPEFRGRGR